MAIIKIETKIKAPIEVCFDLSRSIDLHMDSVHQTKERAIAGKTSGMIDLGETVTWEAIHFGVKQRLKVKITEFDRPNYFQDAQVKGIFAYFHHDHYFKSISEAETLVKDNFEFACPLGVLGKIAEPVVYRHLEKLLITRNQIIKSTAESGSYQKYLNIRSEPL